MIPGFRHKTIKTKTLGQKLKAKRLKMKATLIDAEAATQVRAKFLEALEKNDFLSLPSDVYTVGFLDRYAAFLDLPKEKIIEQFKIEKKLFLFSGGDKQDTFEPRLKKAKKRFVLTPKIMIIGVVTLFAVIIIFYIVYSLKGAMRPPKLTLTKPDASETMATEENFEIVGATEAGAMLTVNAQPVSLDNDGKFKQSVHLQDGLNIFEITTVNRLKRENNRVIKILFKKN